MDPAHTVLPAPRQAATRSNSDHAIWHGYNGDALRPTTYGQQLINRAADLTGVRLGGQGYPGMKGTPVSLDPAQVPCGDSGFLRKRTFAVIRQNGVMCLRLPEAPAEDLVINGMAIRQGKDVLTNAPISSYQLEIAWQILLHAYWLASKPAAEYHYPILAEHVLQHLNAEQHRNSLLTIPGE